jgi:hypothetical protein
LRGSQVGVERDEERDGSRNEIPGAGRRSRCAPAARDQNRESGESTEPTRYRIVSLASSLLIEPERAPKATSVANFSSFALVDGLVWPFPVSEASA